RSLRAARWPAGGARAHSLPRRPRLLSCVCVCVAGDGCGHTVLGVTSGSVASLGYPRGVRGDSVCEWEVAVGAGRTLLLRLGDLDVRPLDCQVTYLRIYDGVGPRRTKLDLISCLERGLNFTEAEFSKFCPAGCLTDFGRIAGTVPHGYRDSSALCLAGIHAGVVSDSAGGQINVVSSKGIRYYDSTLANNVTSVTADLSHSLFTFKTTGCYGTLGMESGVVRDSQVSASSVWEWSQELASEWGPSGARLKRAGLPWAAAHLDQQQWIQVDLKRGKRITGIITTGSALLEHQFYVSAYRVLYSQDGQQWMTYQESSSNHVKIFQGNSDYLHEVRNNFIPPIEARYVRISPTQWHQRIALRMELLGSRPRVFHFPAPPLPPKLSTERPLLDQSTHTPEIRNNTMPPHSGHDVALVAILVPVLVMLLTALVLTAVCGWHWKSRKSTEVTYDLPQWDRTVWWKSMKQLLPSRGEECVRYSSSREVSHLRSPPDPQRLQTEPAEYAQPLVGGMMTALGVRSTFKPEEGEEPATTCPLTPDPLVPCYAEPLPTSGPEYAVPIVVDVANRQPGGSRGDLAVRHPSKTTPAQAPPAKGQAYQVPQNSSQNASGVS
uniref:Discoidin, CUB and LCCL domain containing 2 n=1 Tax=Denticeps clupeoides TaxID=299321 RepID=A0AAY4BIV4_9TELE